MKSFEPRIGWRSPCLRLRHTARGRLPQAATAGGGLFAGVPVSQLRLEGGEIAGPNGAREPLAFISNQDGLVIARPSYPAFSAAALGA